MLQRGLSIKMLLCTLSTLLNLLLRRLRLRLPGRYHFAAGEGSYFALPPSARRPACRAHEGQTRVVQRSHMNRCRDSPPASPRARLVRQPALSSTAAAAAA